MKKGFLRVCLLTALFLMAGTITAFADNSTYITGSKINGFQVGGMTPEEAMQTISQYSSNYYTLTIKEKGGAQETISYQDIDLGTSFQIGDFQSVLDIQNQNGRVFGSNVPLNTEITGTATYDQNKLEERMNGLTCITQQTKTENARISAYQEGQPFTIIPEVDGNSLNEEAVKAAIRTAVAERTKEIDLNALGVYDQITIRSTDEGLNNLLNQMNAVAGIQITYNIRGSQEVLPDLAIVFEGSPADDFYFRPGIAQCSLKQGVQIRHMDSSYVSSPAFIRFAHEVGKKYGIKYQDAVRRGGGTDAGVISLTGKAVPALVLGIPSRYVHTHYNFCAAEDIEATVSMAAEVARGLKEEVLSEILHKNEI